MNVNTIVFSGRLTSDPELKALPNGSNVTNFTLACNEIYKDRDGNKQEKVEFGNIVVYGKQAENCSKYLKKGQQVLVEGKIQTRTWDKDGTKMYRTEIIAQSVQFGAKTESSGNTGAESEIKPEYIPY